MCGIIGIIQIDKKRVDQKILEAMTREIAHRGPDDEGFLVDQNIGLGHRRLAILDLSPTGHQPMFYDNNNLAIVFNGEIYNYLEIKKELQQLGFKFKSQSDTEVILAAYQKWGKDCLKRFNGMWAFIIYDKRENKIFAARDRLGVKPLYYWQDKEKILIASEIKAILKYPGIKPRPNKRIIWQYLVTGWLDYNQETFFEGVKELRGGHYLEIKGKKLIIKKYWDLKINPNSLSDQANIVQFQALFLDAVRLRLRSDVPIGTCLSGGLDSSAIVSVTNQFLKKEKIAEIGDWQKTFSAIYGKNFPEADEQRFIREVIRKTKAKSYSIKPSGKNLAKEIKKLVFHQDQPFSTTSIYAQWNVFGLAASKKMKVILDGQGADELLAGYTGYFGIYFIDLIKKKKIIQFLKEVFLFARLHPPFWKNIFAILARALRAGWLGQKATNLFQAHHQSFKVFKKEFLKSFVPPKRKSFSQDYFQSALYNSIMLNLPPLLRYEDRNSMAFAIESRVPFLDYRLVEFVFSLPHSYKIRDGQTKWIMREALKGILPEKIRTRQDKIGFATPEDQWLRADLKTELSRCFASSSFGRRGYYDQKEVRRLYRDYLAKKFHDSQLFWRMYCLEMWFQVFIEQK